MDENKKKALAAALGQIEKQFGKGTIMRMGDDSVSRDIDVISTGSLGLDLALGIGGLPRGRICEIYGPESSGKTTMTLQVIAECQKAGGTAAFVDAGNAYSSTFRLEETLVSFGAELRMGVVVSYFRGSGLRMGVARGIGEEGETRFYLVAGGGF